MSYFCTRWIERGLALENDIVKEPDKLNVIGFYTMWRESQATKSHRGFIDFKAVGLFVFPDYILKSAILGQFGMSSK